MTNEAGTTPTETKIEPQIGRNEDCPCGSGKKYKRCHGVGAAPKITPPAQTAAGTGANMPGGFDPSQMDPAMMQQMSRMLQRLPRPQMMKLQSIMQRAMAGEDVAQEAAMIEKMLPPEFADMSRQMMMASGMMNQMGANAAAELPKTEDDAKKIIAEAVASGKLTEAQAKELLGADAEKILADNQKKGIGRFFGMGKK